MADTADVLKPDPAYKHNRFLARSYEVNARMLPMRTGAGSHKSIIRKLPKGSKVMCYGYYVPKGSTVWLFVHTNDGASGYCSRACLK